MATKKKNKLEPSAYSKPSEKKKSNVNSLSSETPLARKKAQAEKKVAARTPGTAPKPQRTSQTFKVNEGSKSAKVKKKQRIAPAVYSDDIAPEEAERQRKLEEKRIKRERRQRREALRRNKVGMRILYVVLMYIGIVGLIGSTLFLYVLPHYNMTETITNGYHFVSGEGRVKESKVWDAHEIGGVIYAKMTGIAELCDFATTGDGKSLRYTIKSSGEYIVFTPGLSEVEINGFHARMESTAIFENGALYIPLSFVQTYISGLTTEYTTKNKRLTCTYTNDAEITFKVTNPELTENIIFTSLDYDLQESIIAASIANGDIVDDVTGGVVPVGN